MTKLDYKPVAVQDECLGGNDRDPRIWVFVKLQAQGKHKVHTKWDVREFPDGNYLDKWLKETGLPVRTEAELKPTLGAQALFLAEASSKK